MLIALHCAALHCTTLHDKVSTAFSCRVYTCRWLSKRTSLWTWAATLVRFRRCSFYRSWKAISMLWVLLRTARIQMTEWLLLWWIFSWPVVFLWVCDFDCFDPWRMLTHKCSKRFCNYGSPTLFYLQSIVPQPTWVSVTASLLLFISSSRPALSCTQKRWCIIINNLLRCYRY